jgi:D-3-phosphoglycerate dehydrogenase
MINAETLNMMKDGVRIINLSRADLVNAESIKAAIEDGKVASYVTDFPTEETINCPGIITIPHLGASTAESEDNCAVMAAQELCEFLTTGNIKNSVNYPTVSIPHTGAARICLAHHNIANTLASITSIVSGAGINIENLSNGSKGDYAYTIVEIGVAVPDEIIPKLESIEGMIRVRIL